jgi:hypothetical protein
MIALNRTSGTRRRVTAAALLVLVVAVWLAPPAQGSSLPVGSPSTSGVEPVVSAAADEPVAPTGPTDPAELSGLTGLTGLTSSPNQRSVHGGTTVLSPNPFPWMTALLDPRTADPYQAQFCAGMLVASTWILTAAHCVAGLRNDEVQVAVGMITLSSIQPSQRLTVSEIHIHPRYQSRIFRNDIAMLRLKSPVSVPPVKVISPGRSLPLDTPAVVLGWGDLGYGGFPNNLQRADVTVAAGPAEPTCGYHDSTYDGSVMVCAAKYGDLNMAGVCPGDSGGPLLIRVSGGWELAGITSWGWIPCWSFGYPGVFTRVSAFGDWVGYLASKLPSGDPLGSLDSVSVVQGRIRAAGWAIDPDTVDPIQVHFYLNGRWAGQLRADVRRSDIGAAFPLYGPAHGYVAVLSPPPGRHTVCAYGINVGAGRSNPQLGCRTVVVSDQKPVGSLDRLLRLSPTRVAATGWAADPDVPRTPLVVHAYVNGVFAGVATASEPRPDVGAAFPAFGPDHGYTAAVTAASGARVCLYAINQGAGSTNPLLGCLIA